MIREVLEAALVRALLRNANVVGSGVRLIGRPHVENLGHLAVGDGVELSSSPVQSHLVVGPQGAIHVERKVRIGHGAAIVSHARVTICEGAVLGPFAMIMDTDFHQAGNHAEAGEPKPIYIGPGAVLEGRVTVLRGSTIGEGARVRAGSVVSGEVPAGAEVFGVPARQANASAGNGFSGSSDEKVSAVVRATFQLPQLPAASAGPEQIPGWDSLGALKLLLALEEAFGITLTEHDMVKATSVAELGAVVQAAMQRSAAQRQ